EKKRKEEEKNKKKDVTGAPDSSDLEKKRREAEALLQSMGIAPDITNVPAPMSPSAKSMCSETGSQDSGDGNSRYVCMCLPDYVCVSRRGLRLGMAKVTQVDFPPKQSVSYSKETQTPTCTQTHTQEEEEEEEMAEPKPAEESQEEKADQEENEEEKLHLLLSEEFMTFFDRGSRIVERALSERVDVCFDYSGRDLEDKEGEMQAGTKMSLNRYPELLVASYNNNEEAPHEPDGVALVWNMKYKKTTPEYTFHCQSAVMSAAFARFHPNLVVGGTYSGQIVLWDNRSNKRTPVQRTPLSASAHTHPVYCVNVVGTQNAHNLISISTDGKMCSWEPGHDSLELVFKQSKAVAVTSMAFPLGDVNNFVVGSEDGSVYTACRHGRVPGISDVFEGHHGPVTGLSCHSAGGPVDFLPSVHLLPSLSLCDYVYDVMWSPTHPALFACVDGSGRLDLWNLNNDTEVHTSEEAGGRSYRRTGEIATGDSDGQVLVYDVGEQICVPKADEWTRLVHTLVEINENRDEGEELAAQRLVA
uniref:Dynein cytoplasmic 1 intermediate chain 2 n=1 Tax=Salmo trutta TaxID=8032 RepID=A0A674A4V9_SALTR